MNMKFRLEELVQRPHEPVLLEQPVPVAELPTPVLTLNRTALLRNLDHMQAHVTAHHKGIRPHAKTHKCPELARLQLERSAVGICCAKLSEALVMFAAGVGPVLLTSPLASETKVQSLLWGLETFQVDDAAVVVDSLVGLELLENQIQNRQLGVLVDLDVSMGRTGCRDDDVVRQIVERVQLHPNLVFKGYQHYAGHVMHIAAFSERRERSLALWEKVVQRIEFLGFEYEILTGCGTGTFDIDVEVAPITDLQVGSYAVMDEEYRQIEGKEAPRLEAFDIALHVQATAISQPMRGAITLDAGFKSMASETVAPVCDDLAGVRFRFAGDEHGVLIGEESMQSVHLGDVVELVSPHCDPTVNLHDYFWVLDEDRLVREIWPISARGCTW